MPLLTCKQPSGGTTRFQTNPLDSKPGSAIKRAMISGLSQFGLAHDLSFAVQDAERAIAGREPPRLDTIDTRARANWPRPPEPNLKTRQSLGLVKNRKSVCIKSGSDWLQHRHSLSTRSGRSFGNRPISVKLGA